MLERPIITFHIITGPKASNPFRKFREFAEIRLRYVYLIDALTEKCIGHTMRVLRLDIILTSQDLILTESINRTL